MNRPDNSTFHIPEYANSEPKTAQDFSKKIRLSQLPEQKKKKTIDDKHIFDDLLLKSREISQARSEAEKFLRGIL